MKQSLSIIIPAYNSYDYIKDCLDSIKSQTYFKDFNDYEILIGVDGCEQTLKKLLKIRKKYKNLRIFSMDSNKGPYITKNTLISLANKLTPYILFDSDDVMLPNFIEDNMNMLKKYQVIYNRCNILLQRENNKFEINESKSSLPDGIISFRYEVINKLGGFQPWSCAADTEFKQRCKKAGLLSIKMEKPLFLYRSHDKSIVHNEKFEHKSFIRKNYIKIMYRNKVSGSPTYIKPVINTFKEI